ncbi:protein MgtS, partial [Salmonella enterica subsp. enterica serovar Mbandaka]|nr:protein MgtS [Salmonella enterica subsp. enterica serovar Mbandaka]
MLGSINLFIVVLGIILFSGFLAAWFSHKWDDAEKMTIEQAKTLHDGATVSLRGNLIDHKGDDRYVFRDKSG